MKAAVLKEHGGREKIQVEDIPIPEPGPTQARLKVQACALNWLDVAVRQGPKFGAIDLPIIGGGDIAGVIDSVGDLVEDWRPGDEVVVYPLITCGVCEFCRAGDPTVCPEHRILGEHIDGGLAEYTIAPAANLLRKPKILSFVEAAAVPIVYMTAWHMLITKSDLSAGETILILGAGGGVASAGIEIARLSGARVIATTSTEDKAKRARELGAHRVFNYRDEDWVQAVIDETRGRGVDLVQDNVGAKTWPKALQTLARNGRLVSTGSHSGTDVTFNLSQVYHRQIRIIGANGGTYPELATILGLMETEQLRPIIDTVLPLEQIHEGHRRLEAYEHFGKVVIEIGD
jgi:NADPH:quinone reductase-like Zn-dependent oxidoreductase